MKASLILETWKVDIFVGLLTYLPLFFELVYRL